MTEEEALEYIYSRRKFAKSCSFERIEALLEKLHNPQDKLSFIHTAGTNGKGSVCTMLSSCLVAGGYKTGLFISPYVVCFRERIQINGKFIPKEKFCQITQRVKEASEALLKDNIAPTFFETCLAVALCYYESEKCDIVILEAGIGGRDDSTNIIKAPLVSVITSVSFDHTDVLGKTLYEISKHKSAIIKENSVCVSFPKENASFDFVPQMPQTQTVLEKECKEKNVNLVYPNMLNMKKSESNCEKTVFLYKGKKYEMRFTGDHQIANAAVALEVIEALSKKGFNLSYESVNEGFKKAFIAGRLEVVDKNPTVIIDGGHNVGCMKALKSFVKENLEGKEITAVLGFMKDKDYKASLEIIAPICKNIVFTLCDKVRGEDAFVLANAAKGYCENIYAQNDIEKAFLKGKSLTDEKGVLICAGSFYLISEIRCKFFSADT